MEHDIVFSDEVYEACVLILPPLLPCAPLLRLSVTQFLGVGNVSYRCVKPHIEHLTLSALYRHGDAPIQVARHGAGLQVHVEPGLTLAIDIAAPLLVTLQYPLLQPVLILVQRQIPVLCGAFHESVTRVILVGGVYQLIRRERSTALLALITVSALGMTARTFAHDVAVRKEFASHLITVLLLRYLLQFVLVIERTEEISGKLMVYITCGAAVDIE